MDNIVLIVPVYKILPCLKKLNFELCQDIYVIFFSCFISENILIF